MLSSEIELMPGEKIVLASNPHWFYFWKQVLAAAGIIGLLLLLTVFDGTLGDVIWWIIGIAVIVLLIDIGIEFARWKTTRFAVTDQRVAYQTGLLRRRGVSIPLNRINNVNSYFVGFPFSDPKSSMSRKSRSVISTVHTSPAKACR